MYFVPFPHSRQMTYKDLISRVGFWDNNDISRSSGLNNQYVAKIRFLEADDSMGYGTNMTIWWGEGDTDESTNLTESSPEF